ncbi:glycosyltransferase family protein [Brevibacillus migulae]|uniref:glycosyltransferase family 1 protein n=1 Tax=Brevibacillus migulae TaxID=1644114 RepID=UPI00106E1EDF|nr:glycosyltransferase family 1 protein [Brevibacillus migulae]
MKFDCVLPFEWKNGTDKFHFKHIKFYQATNLNERIVSLNQLNEYDLIFIRGRKQAIRLLEKDASIGKKLLFLNINYNLNDPRIMKEVNYLWKNSRVMFFQSTPLADRFKAYMRHKKVDSDTLEKKIKVLPQYVQPLSKEEREQIKQVRPLHLLKAGVIRPRYGLPVAVRAIQLIRKEYPKARLHLLYPSIVNKYRLESEPFLKSPGVVSHGEASAIDTKKMIVKAGIGLALLYDNTPDKTPSHAYLSRVLEYASLGAPVLTTRTPGNVDLFGQEYPLFVENEYDILNCYKRLQDPEFYESMSTFVSQVGKAFVGKNAVEKLWTTMKEVHQEKKSKGR